MVLVDTSIWINHFRKKNDALISLLEQTEVCTHPLVIGEIACGNLRNRSEILELFQSLPSAVIASDEEVHQLIESKKLMGEGIGWIDAHLIASSLLSGSPLWTGDKSLRIITASLGLLY